MTLAQVISAADERFGVAIDGWSPSSETRRWIVSDKSRQPWSTVFRGETLGEAKNARANCIAAAVVAHITSDAAVERAAKAAHCMADETCPHAFDATKCRGCKNRARAAVAAAAAAEGGE